MTEADPNAEDGKTKPDTFTQADLDRIVKERVARERAKFADYDELKAKVAAAEEAAGKDKSDSEKLAEQVAALTKNLEDERAGRLRAEVIAEKKLTPAQAKRLNGATREELEADADDILENLPAPKAKDDAGDGGQDAGSGGNSTGDAGTSTDAKRPKPNSMQGTSGANGSTVDVKTLIDSIPPTA